MKKKKKQRFRSHIVTSTHVWDEDLDDYRPIPYIVIDIAVEDLIDSYDYLYAPSIVTWYPSYEDLIELKQLISKTIEEYNETVDENI